jgi:hypothetical protein
MTGVRVIEVPVCWRTETWNPPVAGNPVRRRRETGTVDWTVVEETASAVTLIRRPERSVNTT